MDVDLAGLHPPLSDDDLVPPGDFAYFDKSLASKLPSVSLRFLSNVEFEILIQFGSPVGVVRSKRKSADRGRTS